MPPIVSACRAAFFFLTRIPVGGFPYSPAAWQWSSGWFPFVGLVLGAVLAATWLAVENAGPFAAATLVTGLGMLLTGAFHEDGMADTADALGGVVDRDKVFEILKDSRIGAFAAASLIITLLLRISLLARLAELAPATVPGLIVVSQCLARTPPVWLMATIPYVTQDDVSKSKLVTRAGLGQACLATAWGGLGMGIGLVADAVTVGESTAALVAVVTVTLFLGWRFVRRIGGLTGDFLGATEQCAEVAFLLAVAVVRGSGAA